MKRRTRKLKGQSWRFEGRDMDGVGKSKKVGGGETGVSDVMGDRVAVCVKDSGYPMFCGLIIGLNYVIGGVYEESLPNT